MYIPAIPIGIGQSRLWKQCQDFSTALHGDDKFVLDRVATWFACNAHRPLIQQFREVTVTDSNGRAVKKLKRNGPWKFNRDEFSRVMKKAFAWNPGDGMPKDVEEGLQNLDTHWAAILQNCPDNLKVKLKHHSGIKVSF